jgi:hypothetical protein
MALGGVAWTGISRWAHHGATGAAARDYVLVDLGRVGVAETATVTLLVEEDDLLLRLSRLPVYCKVGE